MTRCQLLYYTEVDAIGIRMDPIDDVLISMAALPLPKSLTW